MQSIVIKTVSETMKAEIRSYSDALKKYSKTQLMAFGLPKEKNDNLKSKDGEVFFTALCKT